jgi:hypothetical protein
LIRSVLAGLVAEGFPDEFNTVPSPRPPGEPLRRSEQPVLHRHQAAAIDAERLKLNEERRALKREREAFRQQQAAARGGEAEPPAPEQPRPAESKRAETVVPLGPANPTATTAAAIVRAGQIRRNELVPKPPAPRTEAEKMAAMIVAAAAKARSAAPLDPELPENLTARAIVLCGQKARGTIDAAGQRWLADYFGKMEATRELMR